MGFIGLKRYKQSPEAIFTIKMAVACVFIEYFAILFIAIYKFTA